MGYLPVSGCYGMRRNVSRGSGPLAASSRKPQVRGHLRVHGWIYPAYRPARRSRKPVTWAFALESCPKCPCRFPPLFHHAESSVFSQVSASQGSNGFANVTGRPRFATFRAARELVFEGWFGSSACGVAQRRGRAPRHGASRCGPMGNAPRRDGAAGQPRTAAIRTASAPGAGCAPVGPEPAPLSVSGSLLTASCSRRWSRKAVRTEMPGLARVLGRVRRPRNRLVGAGPALGRWEIHGQGIGCPHHS